MLNDVYEFRQKKAQNIYTHRHRLPDGARIVIIIGDLIAGGYNERATLGVDVLTWCVRDIDVLRGEKWILGQFWSKSSSPTCRIDAHLVGLGGWWSAVFCSFPFVWPGIWSKGFKHQDITRTENLLCDEDVYTLNWRLLHLGGTRLRCIGSKAWFGASAYVIHWQREEVS